MAEFAHAFYGNASPRKLTESELIRAIRLMITDEYEAISIYTQLAESTDNALAKEVLLDIANEERVHAGEFLRLLKELAPDEEQWYADGAAEVEAEIAKMAGAPAATGTPTGEEKPATIGSLKE
ncbi:MAG: rubrerythrin [Methanomicrobiales archaeon]|nr:rubrerythrin [Methanomicrobiales archaeon]